MRPIISIREALSLDSVLGRALPGPSWQAWRIVLMSAMGETLSPEELAVFGKLTGRTDSPSRPVEEMAAIVGRRGGKSRALSTMAVFIAALCDHSAALSSGERGIVLLLAPNQKQARVALGYADGILRDSPELCRLIVNRTADTISLANGIDIEVRAANFRQLRGVTCVAVLADESAFFADEGGGSANPDTWILNAVRPTLATTNGPLLIASSPYRKLGALWDIYREFYGQNDPGVLVVKGTSRQFNQSLDQRIVDRAMVRDPASARAEYLAEFRDDIETFISREAVEACIEPGVHERPPSRFRYVGFCDPAGGSGADSMTLCIAHMEGEIAVVDAIREARPPFSPDATAEEFAKVLRSYGIRSVSGDRFGGDYPTESLRRYGIKYELADRSKSEIYIDSLPRLNSRTVRLLDNERLINQLVGLERRHGRTGRDTIDHAPRSHDDIANAAMGACLLCAEPKFESFSGTIDADGKIRVQPKKSDQRLWRRRYYDEQGNEISPPRYA